MHSSPGEGEAPAEPCLVETSHHDLALPILAAVAEAAEASEGVEVVDCMQGSV